MTQAKKGDIVQVNYTGKLPDGTVFDTSQGRRPLQLTLGSEQVIPGFEEIIIGMQPGEFRTATVPVDRAYGQRRGDLIVNVDRSQMPAGLDPKVGQRLEITQENDQSILVTVTGVSEASLTLDANHPLAGRDLTFDIELVGIVG